MTLSVKVQIRNSDKQVNAKTMMTKKTVIQGSTASTYIKYCVFREYLCRSPVDMLTYIDDMVVVNKNTPSTQQ